MTDDFTDGDDPPDEICGVTRLEKIREQALILFGHLIAKQSGSPPPNDEESKTKTQYLSLQEVEQILNEFARPFSDNVSAIVGDTPETLHHNVTKFFAALISRIMSNVIRDGVRQDFIDYTYDSEKNNFVFTATEKGDAAVAAYRRQQENEGSDVAE